VVGVSGLDAWQPGPVPWPWPRSPGRNEDERAVTDADRRRTLVQEHVAGIVYGSPTDRRRHLMAVDAAVLGWAVDAVEVLRLPPHSRTDTHLLVVHLSAPPDADPVDDLPRLADVAPERPSNARADLSALLSRLLPGSALRDRATDRHAYVLSHTTFDKGAEHVDPPGPDQQAPRHLQWSRLLASVNEPVAMSGSLLGPEPTDVDVALSSSWCVTVLQRGAAFVGRTPQREDSFHAIGRVLARSVYLDAILLALVQREVVQGLTDQVPGLLASGTRLAERLDLQRHLIEYRAAVWTQSASESQHMDAVLNAAQRQFGLQDRQTELATDIADLAQMSQLEADRRIGTLLNWLIAISTGAGLAALVLDPGLAALGIGVALSAVIAAAMFLYSRRAEKQR